MKKTLISLLVAGVVGTAAVGLIASEYEEEHEYHERERYGEWDDDDDRHKHRGGSGVAYLSDAGYALYKTECGDCHMAYPPTMLPAASWHEMMRSLDDHFGDNAELNAATASQIGAYLAANAATEGRGEYGERSWRATRDRNPPQRISETDYFRGQHHEIPTTMVAGNPDVGSFSRCEACHLDAGQGDFDEHGVRIPGYGRWDD
jgi:hypothetical protein